MDYTLMVDCEHAAKRLARLAAVQALYQSAYEQDSPDQIIGQNIEQNFISLRDELAFTGSPDVELFKAIVTGVTAQQEDLDAMISSAVNGKVSGERLEKLLRAILRAGIYELHRHSEIPAGIIINDYIDVAHAFFDGKEPSMVNGILDKLSKKLREK